MGELFSLLLLLLFCSLKRWQPNVLQRDRKRNGQTWVQNLQNKSKSWLLNSIRWGSIIAVAQFDDNVFGKLSDETTTEVSPIEPTKEPADSKAISIADFDLIRVIGRGSYAKVLMVELKKTRRLYAMKVIKKELVTDDEVRPCVKILSQWLKITQNISYWLIFIHFQNHPNRG